MRRLSLLARLAIFTAIVVTTLQIVFGLAIGMAFDMTGSVSNDDRAMYGFFGVLTVITIVLVSGFVLFSPHRKD